MKRFNRMEEYPDDQPRNGNAGPYRKGDSQLVSDRLAGRYNLAGRGFDIIKNDNITLHLTPHKVKSFIDLNDMHITHSYDMQVWADMVEGSEVKDLHNGYFVYALNLVGLTEDEFLELIDDLSSMTYDEVIEFFEDNGARPMRH